MRLNPHLHTQRLHCVPERPGQPPEISHANSWNKFFFWKLTQSGKNLFERSGFEMRNSPIPSVLIIVDNERCVFQNQNAMWKLRNKIYMEALYSSPFLPGAFPQKVNFIVSSHVLWSSECFVLSWSSPFQWAVYGLRINDDAINHVRSEKPLFLWETPFSTTRRKRLPWTTNSMIDNVNKWKIHADTSTIHGNISSVPTATSSIVMPHCLQNPLLRDPGLGVISSLSLSLSWIEWLFLLYHQWEGNFRM